MDTAAFARIAELVELLAKTHPSPPDTTPLLLCPEPKRTARRNDIQTTIARLTAQHVFAHRVVAIMTAVVDKTRIYLRTMQNARSPLSAIPVELLALILNEAVRSSPYPGDCIRSISQTCAQWRRVSIARPNLWTDLSFSPQISFSPRTYLPAFVKRSASLPLAIQLEAVSSNPNKIFDYLRGEEGASVISRLSLLSIIERDALHDEGMFRILDQINFPVLASLRVSYERANGSYSNVSSIPGWRIPSVQSLTIKGLGVSGLPIFLEGLSSLAITDAVVNSGALLAFLEQCTRLESVALVDVVFPDLFANSNAPNLSTLRHLLISCRPNYSVYFLSSVGGLRNLDRLDISSPSQLLDPVVNWHAFTNCLNDVIGANCRLQTLKLNVPLLVLHPLLTALQAKAASLDYLAELQVVAREEEDSMILAESSHALHSWLEFRRTELASKDSTPLRLTIPEVMINAEARLAYLFGEGGA